MPIRKNLSKHMRFSLRLLKGWKNLIGAEIGVATAVNAKLILENLDIKKLYLVDIWDKYTENGQLMTANPTTKLIAEENVKDFKQVVFIKNDSIKAAKKIADKTLDFVYIDGNHQYEYVKKDIKAWLPKLKNNGLMAGHDYGKQGVNQAVDELLPQRKFIKGDWYIFK